ncbi:alpha/beta hydrolase [Faecalicatena orotica]|uniref:alpha/beta hydrolase n=1 Tax=Faecalicatena orotica TaxID=1544 RepID=UPI0032167210
MNNHEISIEVAGHIEKKLFDIPYCTQSPSQILDIWYPNEESTAPYPVIVHFHGGGFVVGGHREDSLEPMLRAADRGYAVVSVEYRKCKESRFPAMLYDAKAAVRFLKCHAAKYHLDPDKMALWGPSAGGWIVAMTALTHGNPAFEDLEMGNAGYDSSVAAVVDWCGPCGGFLEMDEAFKKSGTGKPNHNLPDSGESQLLGAPLKEIPELVRMADPCVYVNRSMPPFLIMHGARDAVVPVEQSVRFADTIRKTAGEKKVELFIADEAPHHGRIWWHDDWVSDMVLDYLDKVLKP